MNLSADNVSFRSDCPDAKTDLEIHCMFENPFMHDTSYMDLYEKAADKDCILKESTLVMCLIASSQLCAAKVDISKTPN